VHPPVIMATTWALGNLTGIRSNALQLLFTLLTTLLVTLLTYWFVERPYLRSVQVASVPKGA
jgi:peptidoglycan/LPS O-acetylase OafA/YrhL